MNVGVEELILVGSDVKFEVIDYPARLLQEAQELIDQKKYGLAVIVAHMACEVRVQRSLSAAFKNRNIPEMEDPVVELLSGYNLGNQRIRKVYNALTGDLVQDAPFWSKFMESAKRRNDIVHNGKTATEAEARESLEAATAFVAHLRGQSPSV